MPEELSAIPGLLLAAVLLASGFAKLKTPDSIDGWRDMGVPRPFRQRWLVAAHPWGEIALALGLIALGSWLGAALATTTLALMLVYLVVIVRLLRSNPDPTCSCFGAHEAVSSVTVVRNFFYAALAVAALVASPQLPLVGGPARTVATEGGWAPLTAAALAAVTVVLTMWHPQKRADPQSPAAPQDQQEFRSTRIPALTLQTADGESVNLRELVKHGPQLLLAVLPGCTPCEEALAQVPQWRERLPEVTLRRLIRINPDDTQYTERDEPQSLHDPDDLLRQTLGEWRSPTLLLLGTDGFIVGEPVTGYPSVVEFIDEIEESLREVRS